MIQIKEAIGFDYKYNFKDESGQGLTEYALIIALIAIAVVAGVTTFGGSLAAYYNGIVTTIGCI